MTTINLLGHSLNGQTGTGSYVGSTSPTLNTPVIGTPTSGNLVNCNGLKYLGSGETAFRASRTANQTVTTGTVTKVQLNNEVYDLGGYYDNATNYRYTPLIAGKYQFVFYLNASINAANNDIVAEVFLNGALYAASFAFYNAAISLFTTVVAELEMNGSTDYVEFYSYISSGTVINAGTWAAGHLIRAD